jgi:hypothetical protein
MKKFIADICFLFFVFMPVLIAQDNSIIVYSNGNVGIGTQESTIPADKLTVQGSLSVNGSFNLVPAGTVLMFAGAVAPDGFFICDGTPKSRTAYTGLFSVIGTTFGIGDGSTTFNVPDFRAASPAGAGVSAGYAQNETVENGKKYDDRVQNITGSFSTYLWGGQYGYGLSGSGVFATGSNSGNVYGGNGIGGSYNRTINFDASQVARTGNTTRGKVVGINFVIKY